MNFIIIIVSGNNQAHLDSTNTLDEGSDDYHLDIGVNVCYGIVPYHDEQPLYEYTSYD